MTSGVVCCEQPRVSTLIYFVIGGLDLKVKKINIPNIIGL